MGQVRPQPACARVGAALKIAGALCGSGTPLTRGRGRASAQHFPCLCGSSSLAHARGGRAGLGMGGHLVPWWAQQCGSWSVEHWSPRLKRVACTVDASSRTSVRTSGGGGGATKNVGRPVGLTVGLALALAMLGPSLAAAAARHNKTASAARPLARASRAGAGGMAAPHAPTRRPVRPHSRARACSGSFSGRAAVVPLAGPPRGGVLGARHALGTMRKLTLPTLPLPG